jgi:hypothetical protein
MYTVRWITGQQERTSVRDQTFETKNEALTAIERSNISNVRKLPTIGGKLYAVTLKDK